MQAPNESGYKINAVEGNKCYAKNYRYVFDRKAVKLGEGSLTGNVVKILDYRNQKYAILAVGQQTVTVEVDPKFGGTQVKFAVDGKDFEVWQQEINFRIC